jgi:phytoene dehydrogenase-like protein
VGIRAGMSAIPKTIAASARYHGADIRTNAAVDRVLVRDGRAAGVMLADGEEIQAKLVASNLNPKLTFLKLLEAKELDPECRGAVERFRVEGTR